MGRTRWRACSSSPISSTRAAASCRRTCSISRRWSGWPRGSTSVPAPDGVPRHGGTSVPDPYLMPGAPVRLDGFFRCLRDIEITETGRVARFRCEDPTYLPLLADFLTPALLLDALFRFSMIHLDPTGTMMPVYVPVRCGRTLLVPGINDVTLQAAAEGLTLLAPAPRVTAEGGVSPWARVEDASGPHRPLRRRPAGGARGGCAAWRLAASSWRACRTRSRHACGRTRSCRRGSGRGGRRSAIPGAATSSWPHAS